MGSLAVLYCALLNRTHYSIIELSTEPRKSYLHLFRVPTSCQTAAICFPNFWCQTLLLQWDISHAVVSTHVCAFFKGTSSQSASQMQRGTAASRPIACRSRMQSAAQLNHKTEHYEILLPACTCVCLLGLWAEAKQMEAACRRVSQWKGRCIWWV